MKIRSVFLYISVILIIFNSVTGIFSLDVSNNIKKKYNITKKNIQYMNKKLKNIDNIKKLLIIADSKNKLSENYRPKTLKKIPKKYTQDGKRVYINSKAYNDLIKMIKAAKNDSINLKVISGYRSYLYQKNLYQKMYEKYGKNFVNKYIAEPGHSQHQTGNALDFNSLIIDKKTKKVFQWLEENAYRYGFSLSYPKINNETGYAYEPWHYLYVGKDVSDIIHNIFGDNQNKFLLFINEYINQ